MDELSVDSLVDLVFRRHSPLPPCALELTISDKTIKDVFDVLVELFNKGVCLKYGTGLSVNIFNLNDRKLNTIKEYMQSIGITFNIKYVSYDEKKEYMKRANHNNYILNHIPYIVDAPIFKMLYIIYFDYYIPEYPVPRIL